MSAPVQINGPATVNAYPLGWNAVTYGLQLGAGFALGGWGMLCVLIGLTKLFVFLGIAA